jgi:quercetin 2,3-dioxygenase
VFKKILNNYIQAITNLLYSSNNFLKDFKMRTIKGIHKAEYEPIADLITYRAFPTGLVGMETLNPFIFLNHHGLQTYSPGNNGLPFGPHPHRGMETVTFIIEGDIQHKDSGGHTSTISAGGIQWMKAGKGLIHAEVSSGTFKKEGGNLELLQLWLNLPSKNKMDDPFYKGFSQEEIPQLELNNGNIHIDVISGSFQNTEGAFNSDTRADIILTKFLNKGEMKLNYPENFNILFYIISGEAKVNNTSVTKLNLVLFDNNDEEINIEAAENSILLIGAAPPLNEPIAAQGPFVMNTQDEIFQAYDDYKKGKFGRWEEK